MILALALLAASDVPFLSEVHVGRLLVIDAIGASLVLAIWYVAFARYNRQRGASALRWIQLACRGRGKVTETRWFGSSRLQARLHFASRWFENARLTVSLRPRPLPVHWLLSYYHKQKETLTFEADLDFPPGFQLEVLNHRWCGNSHRGHDLSSKEWELYRPGPVVLTTRAKWTQDLSPVVNALMSSREHSFLKVHFRPDSPNFSATVALDAMQDPDAASGFLTVLRELAAGASAKHL